MVTQAIYDFRDGASEFFVHEPDAVADIGEDITSVHVTQPCYDWHSYREFGTNSGESDHDHPKLAQTASYR